MKVYEAFAKAIAAEECGPVFGVMGDGNMHLITALADLGVPLVHARHEAAAVAMADGYAQRSGGIGLATVTHGPGLTQVGTSLMAANRAGSRVLLIAGDTARRDESGLQDFDQRAFTTASGGGFHPLTTPAALVADVQDAFQAVVLGGGPVVINAPVDLQKESYDWPWDYESVTTRLTELSQRLLPDPTRLEQVVELILESERPIILAGRGVATTGAASAVEGLAEHFGALLGTTLPARGLFYGHEFDLGVVGGLSSGIAEQLLAEADLVVAFGASLSYFTTGDEFIFPEAKVVRVDVRPDRPLRGREEDILVLGDARETAIAIHRALEQRTIPRTGFRTDSTRRLLTAGTEVAPTWERGSGGIDPRELMRVLGEAMPEEAQVVCGLGHFFYFSAMYLKPRKESFDIYSNGFGAIGQALPLAIGAAMADTSRPVVLLEGDGSLMMHLQELDTMARYELDIKLVVMNDMGFGAEAHKLRAQGLDPKIARIPTPDFAAIGAAMGCRNGGVVETVEAFSERIRAAFAITGPTVIDVRIDPRVPSDPYLRLHFGKENRSPRLAP